MNNYKIQLGKLGEKLAADFLKKNNCRIIENNFYTHHGEIDLIARKGDEILFVEVKTRTTAEFGHPEEAVDRRKIKNILRAIRVYCRNKRVNDFWRLDIVSVELDLQTRRAKIRWFKNVGIDI